ncbi:MAG: hypothetical protein GX437_05625 [Sphingobacteriales bacterium]|nr:hypothetical protein [Sphingobacteriales bacterium]
MKKEIILMSFAIIALSFNLSSCEAKKNDFEIFIRINIYSCKSCDLNFPYDLFSENMTINLLFRKSEQGIVKSGKLNWFINGFSGKVRLIFDDEKFKIIENFLGSNLFVFNGNKIIYHVPLHEVKDKIEMIRCSLLFPQPIKNKRISGLKVKLNETQFYSNTKKMFISDISMGYVYCLNEKLGKFNARLVLDINKIKPDSIFKFNILRSSSINQLKDAMNKIKDQFGDFFKLTASNFYNEKFYSSFDFYEPLFFGDTCKMNVYKFLIDVDTKKLIFIPQPNDTNYILLNEDRFGFFNNFLFFPVIRTNVKKNKPFYFIAKYELENNEFKDNNICSFELPKSFLKLGLYYNFVGKKSNDNLIFFKRLPYVLDFQNMTFFRLNFNTNDDDFSFYPSSKDSNYIFIYGMIKSKNLIETVYLQADKIHYSIFELKTNSMIRDFILNLNYKEIKGDVIIESMKRIYFIHSSGNKIGIINLVD